MRLDPYKAFHFLVEIDGLFAAGCTECRGLSVQTETFEYREGGVNDYIHTFAGPTKYPALVLKRGLTPLDGLWDWHQSIVAGHITRRHATIYLLNDQRLPVVWWDVREAYPVRWEGPDLQAGSAAVAFESIELVHRGLTRPHTAIQAAAGALAGALARFGS